MLSFRLLASAPAPLLCALSMGCSDNTPNANPIPSGGAGGSGVAGTSSGMAGAATAGQTRGGSSSGGSSAGADTLGGNVNASGGGGASPGSSGSAGSGGSSTGGAGACSKLGWQADPGKVGDGEMQIDGPYKPSAESQMHLDGAPVGTINDMPIAAQIPKPLIYTATKQYPGLNQMLKYEYWIYVPSQYKAGCPAALMVFQDGMHYVSTDSQFHAPVVFDNLIAKGDMPVTIGVFVNPGEPGDGHYDGNEYQNRHVQYDKHDPAYVNFLVDELLKDSVLPKFAIVDDPEGWAISGHSSGGIAAFIAGFLRPEKFHKLLTHDASFPLPGDYLGMSLMESVESSPLKPLRVYMMSGPNDLGGWYDANNTAFTKLIAKQYHVRYITETSQHFPPQAGIQDFAEALRWMWRGYEL